MSLEQLQSYVFCSKYARWSTELGRRETYEEAVERVFKMHEETYADKDISEELAFAKAAALDKLVLGSQRALQFGGEPIKRKNMRILNCTTSYCDRPRFFQEAFWVLLCGSGVGFSVQTHHVASLPRLFHADAPYEIFMIPDTIEGWADSLGVLLATYGICSPEFPEWVAKRVEFDFSLIRPKGAPLSSGSGKAPGPAPLEAALGRIRDLLDGCVESGRAWLRPIDCYDIVMHMSDAVLSGGVRRSATICIFSPDDQEMVTAKTGNWFNENPQRGRSNNSAMLLRSSTSKEEFEALMKSVKEYGEPGFVWADSTEILYNPCCEIGLYPRLESNDLNSSTNEVTIKTESGWASCVSGDTRLLTRTGVTSIIDAVGTDIEIWNGSKWSQVRPFKTGENRKLYRVKFSDGSFLDATANHKWLVKDRFMTEYKEVETSELLTTSKYTVHVPRTNVVMTDGLHEEFAYEYGILLGDGTARDKHSARVPLYGEKRNLPVRGSWSPEAAPTPSKYQRLDGAALMTFQNVELIDIDQELGRAFKRSKGLPSVVFEWDRDSILRFTAGWADTDGSQANNGIRIYGQEQRLRDLQLLLSKAGIDSSVNLMAASGTKTNFGTRSQAVWYVQITDARGIPCRRLDTTAGTPARCKGKEQTIRSVEELPGRHDTYCLTEEEQHLCVFNNVLTRQCNLCELNMKACRTPAEFARACKAAAILGTLQAGYTRFEYLGEVSEEIARREALLGVSMTGMADNPRIAFDPKLQREMAQLILDVNEVVADKIGINPTARATCVKPAGSTSCILGTSSGIHPQHATRYFRRVQANRLEAPFAYFELHNPRAVEASVWSANETDAVMTFCIEAQEGALTRRDGGALDLLRRVKLTQDNWVAAGKVVERCAQPWLSHNVSNTITVREDEWEDVTDFIYENRGSFAGISILPQGGELDYAQAPFVSVLTPEQLLTEYGVGALMGSGLIVDAQHAFDNDLWAACATVLGVGKLPASDFQADWVRRAKQFANRYFGNDVKKMTHCLKHINNFKLWVDLQREYQNVDYKLMVEDSDETKPAETIACGGGGSCELI